MSYNIEKIKEKIQQLTSRGKKGLGDSNKDLPKIQWFKPGLGNHEIRFLPFKDKNGQPFMEVAYYDSRLLSERRFVSGFQFGLEDPVFEMLAELRKDKSKESWKLWRNLQPRERYYALILVRTEEEKGPQVWELNSKLVTEIYSILAHPDYKDEDMMDPELGYDFTVLVSPTDKTFKGYPVKDIKLQARRKPSPLSKDDDAKRDKWLGSLPNLEAYFQAQVKDKEETQNMLENFLAGGGNETVDVFDEASRESRQVEEKKDEAVTAAKVKKAKKNIDDAFENL